jgi:uncharacterized protein YbjQ (UPF0145 family)
MSAEPSESAAAIPSLPGVGRRLPAVTCLVLSAALSGCGTFVETHEVTQETTARLDDEIRVYQPAELASRKYTTLYGLESWSCKNKLWDPDPTRSDALAQMKLKAREAGANGIKDIYCSSEGTSLATNCWSSMRCVGTAIKVDAQ